MPMRTTIILTFLIAAVQIYANVNVYCDFNHAPPAEYADLPVQPLAGGTVFYPFFEDVEGDNTLNVNENDMNYIAMKSRRDSYESYYDTGMSDISDLVNDLSTPLTVDVIQAKLDSIHKKIEEIDSEYLDAGVDIHAYMDAIDAGLYDDYLAYLATLDN